LCKENASVGARGTVQKDYVYACGFHAGSLQMIFEILNVQDSIKWKPLMPITKRRGS